MDKVKIFGLILFLLIGCNSEKKPLVNNIIVHDTVTVVAHAPLDTKGIEETVKILLIQYYKAGWMDASNHIVDLHNENTLTDKNLKLVQFKDWRTIEAQVQSKSIYKK